jgi:hypothetical protein
MVGLQVRDYRAVRMLNNISSGVMEKMRSKAREKWEWIDRFSEHRMREKVSISPSGRLFSLVCSILPTGLLLSPSAWQQCSQHKYHHHQISVHPKWNVTVHQIHWHVTLSGTDGLWDLLVGIIAHIESFYDYWVSFLLIPFSCCGCSSPGGLPLKVGIMYRPHLTNGQVTAIVYCRLTRSLSYQAIIIPWDISIYCQLDPHLQPYSINLNIFTVWGKTQGYISFTTA